jgi:ABC-type uncharacterized transport system permease subunit
MFELVFIATISLFIFTSAVSIFSLHTDSAAYFQRARWLFFTSSAAFLALGVVRFYRDGGEGLIRGAFTIWGYFYFLALLFILILFYLNFSRWNGQWRPFAAISIPFITFILMLSIPFMGSPRRITVELSHGLLPLHIVITIMGEILFFFSFAGSVLYLVMEWQLRKKSSMKFIYRLPTLESIDNFNRWAVSRSFILFSFGLVSGVFLTYVLFSTPFMNTPKEIILYCAWLAMLGLFYVRYSRRANPHRTSQANITLFAVLMFTFVFANIYITEGFHGFK